MLHLKISNCFNPDESQLINETTFLLSNLFYLVGNGCKGLRYSVRQPPWTGKRTGRIYQKVGQFIRKRTEFLPSNNQIRVNECFEPKRALCGVPSQVIHEVYSISCYFYELVPIFKGH